MAKKLKLRASVRRGRHMVRGKGWRLVSPGRKGFIATLVKKFRTSKGGDLVAIFKIRELKKTQN
jgi:hypothetical protein